MNNKTSIGVFSFIFALISLAVYFLMPSSQKILSFSGLLFLSGELWRIITFPFVHISVVHLVENLIALGVAYLLALEIPILRSHYIVTFFGANLFVAITSLVVFPSIVIAGASVGIYAIYGALSARGSPFISRAILIPLLSLPLLIQLITTLFETKYLIIQLGLHSLGFFFGLSFILFFEISKKPQKILEVNLA